MRRVRLPARLQRSLSESGQYSELSSDTHAVAEEIPLTTAVARHAGGKSTDLIPCSSTGALERSTAPRTRTARLGEGESMVA